MHTCQRANLSLLVQFGCFSLDLLLVIPIQTLDIVYCGLEILHCNAAFYLQAELPSDYLERAPSQQPYTAIDVQAEAKEGCSCCPVELQRRHLQTILLRGYCEHFSRESLLLSNYKLSCFDLKPKLALVHLAITCIS